MSIGQPTPYDPRIVDLLAEIQPERIAVIGGAGTLNRVGWLAEVSSSVQFLVWDPVSESRSVHPNVVLHARKHVNEIVEAVVASGGVQAIIDSTGDENLFTNLFFALPDRGRYILEDPTTGSVGQHVSTLVTSRFGDMKLDGELGHVFRSVASIRFAGDVCVIEKAGNHLYKLRDAAANALLTAKPFRGQFKLLSFVPGGEFSSRVRVRTNNAALDGKRHPRLIRYPELSLRSYSNVNCYQRQVYTLQNLLLPDTFRRIWSPRPTSRAIQDHAHWFAAEPGPPRQALAGAYYALDSEVPGHFGHFTTEVLARVWGWRHAKATFPDLKALVSTPPGQSDLYAWQYGLLDAAGIGDNEVQVLAEPASVERLVAGTPMFSNPKYVHPGVTSTWQDIGRNLARREGSRRIFVGRKPQGGRGCTNAEDVEAYFRARGFTVLYPEDYPIGDQVSFFNNADMIAGFAGSGMFSLMFAREPKKVIVIGSESYDAVNEYLIMAAAGGELTYIWCEPSVPMGPKWSLKAFLSEYHFDFERDGEFLESAVSAL